MITSAQIENFKCFQKLDLPELGQITLVGGRNNAGKTSMLEGLYLLQKNASSVFFYDYVAWHNLAPDALDPEQMLRPLFYNFKLYECLQEAHKGIQQAHMADAFRYIRLERNGTDIRAKTYTYDMVGAAIEHGWEVR